MSPAGYIRQGFNLYKVLEYPLVPVTSGTAQGFHAAGVSARSQTLEDIRFLGQDLAVPQGFLWHLSAVREREPNPKPSGGGYACTGTVIWPEEEVR